MNLLFNDCLDRYPRIKFMLAHAGGTLPYCSWRLGEIMERQMSNDPWDKQYRSRFMDAHAGRVTRDFVLSKIRRFYFDTAPLPGTMRGCCSRDSLKPYWTKLPLDRDTGLVENDVRQGDVKLNAAK